jgi:hypothetical protein
VYKLKNLHLTAEVQVPPPDQLSKLMNQTANSFEYNSISSYYAVINNSYATINLNLGLRRVNVTAGVPGTSRKSAAYNSSFSFNITGTATSMAVRVLADRTLVELFVAGGLGVVTTPVLAPGKDPSRAGAFVFVPQSAAQSAAGDDDSAEAAAAAEGGGAVTVSSASAWEMGCGWAPGGYPGPGPGPPN